MDAAAAAWQGGEGGVDASDEGADTIASNPGLRGVESSVWIPAANELPGEELRASSSLRASPFQSMLNSPLRRAGVHSPQTLQTPEHERASPPQMLPSPRFELPPACPPTRDASPPSQPGAPGLGLWGEGAACSQASTAGLWPNGSLNNRPPPHTSDLSSSHTQRQLRTLRRSSNRLDPHRRSPTRSSRTRPHSAPSTPSRALRRPEVAAASTSDSTLPQLPTSSLHLPPGTLRDASESFAIVYAWRHVGLQLPTPLVAPDASIALMPWLHSSASWLNRQRAVCLQGCPALLLLFRLDEKLAAEHHARTSVGTGQASALRALRVRFRHEDTFRPLRVSAELELPHRQTSPHSSPWRLLNVALSLTRHREIVEFFVEFEAPHAVQEVIAVRHSPAMLRAAILHARAGSARRACNVGPAGLGNGGSDAALSSPNHAPPAAPTTPRPDGAVGPLADAKTGSDIYRSVPAAASDTRLPSEGSYRLGPPQRVPCAASAVDSTPRAARPVTAPSQRPTDEPNKALSLLKVPSHHLLRPTHHHPIASTRTPTTTATTDANADAATHVHARMTARGYELRPCTRCGCMHPLRAPQTHMKQRRRWPTTASPPSPWPAPTESTGEHSNLGIESWMQDQATAAADLAGPVPKAWPSASQPRHPAVPPERGSAPTVTQTSGGDVPDREERSGSDALSPPKWPLSSGQLEALLRHATQSKAVGPSEPSMPGVAEGAKGGDRSKAAGGGDDGGAPPSAAHRFQERMRQEAHRMDSCVGNHRADSQEEPTHACLGPQALSSAHPGRPATSGGEEDTRPQDPLQHVLMETNALRSPPSHLFRAASVHAGSTVYASGHASCAAGFSTFAASSDAQRYGGYDASDDEDDDPEALAAELRRLRAEAKAREVMAVHCN